MHCFLYFLFLLCCDAAFSNFVFPGCQVRRSAKIETEKDFMKVLVSPFDSQVQIIVKQEKQYITKIQVPIPYMKWSSLHINLRDKVNVISTNGSVYPSPKEQTSVNRYPIKTITVGYAYVLTDCPQGLPYKIANDYALTSFPSPEDEELEEVYLLFPLTNLRVKFCFCQYLLEDCLHYLCWNEKDNQLKLKNDSLDCPQLPEFRYYWIRFYFENGQVKVMNEEETELGTLMNENDARVCFVPDIEKKMLLVQCFKKDCKAPEPHTQVASGKGNSTEEGPRNCPQNNGQKWFPLYTWLSSVILLLLGLLIAMVGLLCCHRRQILMY